MYAVPSGRSCSAARRLFFEADAVSVKKPPDRTDSSFLLALIEQAALDLLHCQIMPLPHQRKQTVLMLLERRTALTFDRPGLDAASLPKASPPADRGRIPNIEVSR